MYGTIITIVVYIFGTVVLFGILPTDVLKNSAAPFAEAGKIIGGDYAGYFVAAGAAIAAIGCLNGWILLSEQAGCDVTAYKGKDISVKGGGGPTCLTRPMLRSH